MNHDKIKGVGLSLRFPHFNEVLKFKHNVPWFEVIADDFLIKGPHWQKLMKLREKKPIAMHSIGMNVGGVDPWDEEYLKKLKETYSIFQPEWISDHLCWSSYGKNYHHDLLPIPKTKEGLINVVERIEHLQHYFSRPLVLENITQYIDFNNSDYSELDFIKEVVKRSGCYLLLDITNVVINHKNRNEDYDLFLQNYPIESVKQFHLAGGVISQQGVIIDTHTESVGSDDLNALFKIYKKGHIIPGVIERDGNLPSFIDLNSERINAIEVINEL